MLSFPGVNEATATTSFTDVLLLAAAGMAIFYQISAFTSLASVGGFFFYRMIYYLLTTTKFFYKEP